MANDANQPVDTRPLVLVVDDTPDVFRLLKVKLRHEAIRVEHARSGTDAMAMAHAIRPDAILLDIDMPGMDGIEVLRLLKVDPELHDIPVLMLSAHSSPEHKTTTFELGAVDYITKPVDLMLAKLRIHNHLELKRQRDQIEAQNAMLTRQKAELEATLQRVKRLEGILAICMHCRKVRTEDNAWQLLEQYVSEHTDALFSHGICPSCLREHWSI